MWTWRRFLYEIRKPRNRIDYTNHFNASAKGNGKFICISTYIAGGFTAEPHADELFFQPTESASSLGKGIRQALSQSHRKTWKNEEHLFTPDQVKQGYLKWISDLMERYQYKTKRALFKDMMSCSIAQKDDMITIRPSRHEKLEAWSGDAGWIKPEDIVTLPVDCTDEELGQGLLLAFSRCWPKTPWVKELMDEFERENEE